MSHQVQTSMEVESPNNFDHCASKRNVNGFLKEMLLLGLIYKQTYLCHASLDSSWTWKHAVFHNKGAFYL